MHSGLSIDQICRLLEAEEFDVRLERVDEHLAKARIEGKSESFTIFFGLNGSDSSYEQLSFLMMWKGQTGDDDLSKINAFNCSALVARAYWEDDYLMLRHRFEVGQETMNEATFKAVFELWLKDVAKLGELE